MEYGTEKRDYYQKPSFIPHDLNSYLTARRILGKRRPLFELTARRLLPRALLEKLIAVPEREPDYALQPPSAFLCITQRNS